jgi:hypothetical protein
MGLVFASRSLANGLMHGRGFSRAVWLTRGQPKYLTTDATENYIWRACKMYYGSQRNRGLLHINSTVVDMSALILSVEI